MACYFWSFQTPSSGTPSESGTRATGVCTRATAVNLVSLLPLALLRPVTCVACELSCVCAFLLRVRLSLPWRGPCAQETHPGRHPRHSCREQPRGAVSISSCGSCRSSHGCISTPAGPRGTQRQLALREPQRRGKPGGHSRPGCQLLLLRQFRQFSLFGWLVRVEGPDHPAPPPDGNVSPWWMGVGVGGCRNRVAKGRSSNSAIA